MKCSLCGAEFSDGLQNCPACGNFIGRTDSRVQVPPPVYGAQPAYPQSFMYQPVQQAKPKHSTAYKIIMSILLVIIGFIALCVVMAIVSDRTKTYDMGSFEIELEVRMEKQGQNDFDRSFRQLGAGDSGVYENDSVRFGYAVFDSEKGDFSTPQLVIAILSASLTQETGYLELEKGSDFLRYNVLNDDNKMTYCHTKAIKGESKTYLLMLVCNEKQQDRYEKKFDQWLSSFTEK